MSLEILGAQLLFLEHSPVMARAQPCHSRKGRLNNYRFRLNGYSFGFHV